MYTGTYCAVPRYPGLAVFRCLSITATENTERSKGKNTHHDNSGTLGVAVGVMEGEVGYVLDVGDTFKAEACELGAVKNGINVTVPTLKLYFESYIVWLIAC